MAIVDYQRRMKLPSESVDCISCLFNDLSSQRALWKAPWPVQGLPSLIDLEPFIALRKKKTFAYDIQMNKHNCNQRIKKEQEN